MASKAERASPAVPNTTYNSIGSPLAKVFDKKAKGYLKALQRSFSSSSLENNSPTSDEDPTAMTIEFLRARLQAERANCKAEKHRAEALSRKVFELEHKLMEEIQLRKKTELSSHYQAMMRSDKQSSMHENHGSASPSSISHGTSSTTGDSDDSIEEIIEVQPEEDEAEVGNLDNCIRYRILRNPSRRNMQMCQNLNMNVYHELPPKPNSKPMQHISGKQGNSEGEIVAEEIEIEKENEVNNNINVQGSNVPKSDTSPTKDRKIGKTSKVLNDQCSKHYTNPVFANGTPVDVRCSPCHDPLGCTIPQLWQSQWCEEAQIAANQDYQIDMLYRTLSKARELNPNLFQPRTPSPKCREPMIKSCSQMQRSSSLPLHFTAQNPCAIHSPQHPHTARIQIENLNAVREMLRALHVTRPQIENTGSRNQMLSQSQSPSRFYHSPSRKYW